MTSFRSENRLPLCATALAAALVLLPALAAAQSPAATAMPDAASSFSNDQRHVIEGIIKDYLVAHPEVLQEAMDALDKRQKEAEADKARATIRDNKTAIFNS